VSHLPVRANTSLSLTDRRRLGYLWATRAVREHAHAALEDAGYLSLAHSLRAVRDIKTKGAARKAALVCAWTGAKTLLAAGLARALGHVDGRGTARALYTLLDAAQASLVAAAVESPEDLSMVGERVISAASTAPWRQDGAGDAPGSRAWAAGPAATVEAAADDERRAQQQELKFTLQLSMGGPGRHLADRRETLGELAA
jgi:hypothetical protein